MFISNIDLCVFVMFQLEPGKEYTFHAPTQSPIDPPYKQACLLRKSDQLAKESSHIQHSNDTEQLTMSLAGDTLQSSGDSLQASGDILQASGDTLQASGDSLQASGDILQASGDTLQASGNTLQAFGDIQQASGDTLQASGDTMQASGDTMQASGDDTLQTSCVCVMANNADETSEKRSSKAVSSDSRETVDSQLGDTLHGLSLQ